MALFFNVTSQDYMAYGPWEETLLVLVALVSPNGPTLLHPHPPTPASIMHKTLDNNRVFICKLLYA